MPADTGVRAPCETRRETRGSSTWMWCACLPELRLAVGHGRDKTAQLEHLHRVRAALDADVLADLEPGEEVTVP